MTIFQTSISMNKIDAIKEDYNIGDPIRIECRLGIKEGYIIEFKEDRIKLRPFESGRKPISIAEDSIGDFEEAFPPSETLPIDQPNVQVLPRNNEKESLEKKEELNNTKNDSESIKCNNVIDSVITEDTHNGETRNESPKETDFNNGKRTEIKVGDIKITSIGKIDLSTIPTTKKETERRKNALSLITQPNDKKTVSDMSLNTSSEDYYDEILNACRTDFASIISSATINLSNNIPTNATVRHINEFSEYFGTAISDTGDVLLIQEEGFVGNPDVLQNEGARLYCRPQKEYSPKTCYVTISDLNYEELTNLFNECLFNKMIIKAISIVKTLRSIPEFNNFEESLKELYTNLKKASKHYYRGSLVEIDTLTEEEERRLAEYIKTRIENESAEYPIKDGQIRSSYAYKYRIIVPIDIIASLREKLGFLSEEYRRDSTSFIQNYDEVFETIKSINTRFDIDQAALLEHLRFLRNEIEYIGDDVSLANAFIKKVNKNMCKVHYDGQDLKCFYNAVLDFDLLKKISQKPEDNTPVRVLTFLNKKTQQIKVSNIVSDCTIKEHFEKLLQYVEAENYLYARRYLMNLHKYINPFLTKSGKMQLKSAHNILSCANFVVSELPIIVINYSTKVQAEQEGSKNVALSIVKEVDQRIEQSDIDGAIYILDNTISKNVLLPKEQALLMQKKVQILTSLDRANDATAVYSEWISYGIDNGLFTEKKVSRMYADLARIQSSIVGQEQSALMSLDKAIEYNPDNKLAINFREQILEAVAAKEQHSSTSLMVSPEVRTNHIMDVVSAMLDLDIQEHKFSDKRIINNEGVPTANIANEMYLEARQTTEVDSFPLYLETAKAFHELKYYDQQAYLYVVANYAKLKADYLLRSFKKLLATPSKNILTSLYRLRDSAQSYYLESLNLWSYISFEDEDDDNNSTESHDYDSIVLEILVNHLVLDVACHYAKSEQMCTYDFNSLFSMTFKEVFFDCVKSKDEQLIKIAAGTIVKIGSYNSSTWNNLVSLPNGTSGLYGILSDRDIREKLYASINCIEEADFSIEMKPKDLLQAAFSKHSSDRYEFEKMADKFREEILSPHSMESVTSQWNKLSPFYRLLSMTDIETVSVIEKIFLILKPYLHRSDEEKSLRLDQVTELIDEQIRFIDSNTTFYGRKFFYPLLNKWASEIRNLRRERVANKHPQLSVSPDPSFILYDKGHKYVNLIVRNSGETTAEGFVIHLVLASHSTQEKFDYINRVQTDITSNQLAGLSVQIEKDIDCTSGVDVWCGVSAVYQSKTLPEIETRFTLEEEPSSVLTLSDIEWSDGPITPKQLFFGRQDLIDKFEKHYLSPNRHKPYILYGLTRTGKSSIVKYLGEQITGKRILINGEYRTVLHFSMDLDDAAKCPNAKEVWTFFIRRCLFEKILEYSKTYDIDINRCTPSTNPRSYELEDVLRNLKECGYYPFITMDEFSHMKTLISSGRLTSAFLHTLRKDAFDGLASFMYIGTYDINDLMTDKQYGITGQLTHCIKYQLNEIDRTAAKGLINILGEKLIFTEEAQELICKLSGCVPYFIQIICQNCGFYAVDHGRRFIGYPELIEVIKILTGETELYDDDSLVQRLTINAFEDNQYSAGDPDYVLGLIASISYLNKDCDDNNVQPRGIAIPELEKLWINYGITNAKYYIGEAIKILKAKQIIHQNDEGLLTTYEIIVDLYRRWCKVEYPNIDLTLSSLLKSN